MSALPITTDVAARSWLQQMFSPTTAQWASLETYVQLLHGANQRQNLIAASTLENTWARHIADSAQLLLFDKSEGQGVWLDLGSGPGLPGLVIALLSERPIILVESRALRCEFLSETVDTLGLAKQVQVAHIPIERLSAQEVATISARAFAALPQLIAASARFATSGTRWLLPKGRKAVNELALLSRPWQKLFHVEQSVTEPSSGIIVGTGTVESWRKH